MAATPVLPSTPTLDIENNTSFAAVGQLRKNQVVDPLLNIPRGHIPNNSDPMRRLIIVDENWW